MKVDPEAFGLLIEQWLPCTQEMGTGDKDDSSPWVHIDGKSIRGSAQKEENQKIAHLVSFFSGNSHEVLMARKTADKSHEIPLVQQMLLKSPLKKRIFTMDAMHCQKETLRMVVEGDNDYVVQVKGNQKNSMLSCNAMPRSQSLLTSTRPARSIGDGMR